MTKQAIVRGLVSMSALLVLTNIRKDESSATVADARVAVLESEIFESDRLVAKRSARIPFTAGELSW